MTNLIAEIGNTALKIAWVDGETVGKTYRYQGENKIDYIISIAEKEKPGILAISSVVPLSDIEKNNLKTICGELLVIDNNVKNDCGFPEYLSPDRVCSLYAAKRLFKGKSCTVFDFGTTLTIDFLDSEGNYEGGNISLGCRTRFKALNRYSKGLPLLETPEKVESLGYSENSAIEAGVIKGIMFEIQAYIDSKPGNIVIFTGGDAFYFVKTMKNSIFAVCNLCLMGLALITDEYVQKNNR